MRSAATERALAERLRRERRVLLRAWALPAALSTERKLALKDQAGLNEQLGLLVERGVPLVEALDVAGTVVAKSQRERITSMRDMVASGTSFADAARDAGGMDPVTVAVYRAAEQTGDLGGAATQLAGNARRTLAVQQKALTLMIYPTIVAIIGALAGLAMLIFIVPLIAGTLKEQLGELNPFTNAMYETGTWIQRNPVIFAAGAFGLFATGVVFRAPLAKAVGRVASMLPAFKGVLLAQQLTRLFSVLGAMSRAGVPLADAIGVSASVISEERLRGQLEHLRARLIQGAALGKLIEEVDRLPAATRKLLVAADRAGDLDQAFTKLASDMGDLLDRQTARLLAILEPLLLVILFFFIGSMVLSVMIPILTAVGRGVG